MKEVGNVLRDIVNFIETWETILTRYPLFEAPLKEKSEKQFKFAQYQ